MFTIALACELLHMHICQLSFFMGKIEHLYGYFKNEPAIIPFFFPSRISEDRERA